MFPIAWMIKYSVKKENILKTICFTFPRNATLYAIIWKRYVFKRKHFFIYIEQNVGKRLSYPSFFLNKRERDATEYKSHSLIISAFVNRTIKFTMKIDTGVLCRYLYIYIYICTKWYNVLVYLFITNSYYKSIDLIISNVILITWS